MSVDKPMPVGRLSAHFTLQEMIKSQTATRRGIDNAPEPEHIDALRLVCRNVLEPVREEFKRPVIINSGYRSKKLCKAIGSKTTSQHSKGEAIDFEIPGVSNVDTARFIRDNLDYDQLILEYYNPDDPAAGWVHCSYKADGNRKQALIFDGDTYKYWSD